MKRNQFLSMVSILFLPSLAGCFQSKSDNQIDDGDDKQSDPEMPNDDRKPVSTDPRDIQLRNEHKKTHKILLKVQFDGKTIHNQQYTLKPDSTAVVEDLAGKVGGYTITTSSDGEQEVSNTWSVTDNSTAVLVEISEEGELELTLDPQM